MAHQQNPAVYKTLAEVWKCLQAHQDIPEVTALMKLCVDRGLVKRNDEVGDGGIELQPCLLKDSVYPFVVIEGLDGTGKTTLTRHLSEKLSMKLLFTPPKYYDAFAKAREYFADQPESLPIKQAYYSLGNYIAALDVRDAEQPVVMDRYWHSTAAYGVAHRMKSGESLNLSDLIWPSDLLQPDLVIFLHVSEEERSRRHSNRKDFTNTEEEKMLEEVSHFRRNIVHCYKSIQGPQFTELLVDGKQPESEYKILETVLNAFPAMKGRENLKS